MSSRNRQQALATKLLASAPDVELPAWLLADKGFDDDGLAGRLAKLGVTLLAPHRQNRKKLLRCDSRTTKRLRKRDVVERAFYWLPAFRRMANRYERWSFIHAGFVALACLIIVARTL